MSLGCLGLGIEANGCRWVLDEYEKLVNRRMELAMAHSSLMGVIEFLSQFEPLGCCGSQRDSRTVEVDVEREIFEERDKGLAWEERDDGEFVEKRRKVVVDERDERDRAFVEGREEKIVMVDREKEEQGDPGYGYFGGMGPRRRSDPDLYQSRKTHEYDEPEERTTIRKRVYDYDLPDREVRERRVYETRGRGRETDIVRERSIHEEHGHGRDSEVSY